MNTEKKDDQPLHEKYTQCKQSSNTLMCLFDQICPVHSIMFSNNGHYVSLPRIVNLVKNMWNKTDTYTKY